VEVTWVEFDCLQSEKSSNDSVPNLLPIVLERIEVSELILVCIKVAVVSIVQRETRHV
jgi:hypothetical protein